MFTCTAFHKVVRPFFVNLSGLLLKYTKTTENGAAKKNSDAVI
jgi:hypothetical protein